MWFHKPRYMTPTDLKPLNPREAIPGGNTVEAGEEGSR